MNNVWSQITIHNCRNPQNKKIAEPELTKQYRVKHTRIDRFSDKCFALTQEKLFPVSCAMYTFNSVLRTRINTLISDEDNIS